MIYVLGRNELLRLQFILSNLLQFLFVMKSRSREFHEKSELPTHCLPGTLMEDSIFWLRNVRYDMDNRSDVEETGSISECHFSWQYVSKA